MKRFLSLVLSALFVFQLGNASCDAVSHYRGNVQNYNMGSTPQGQPVIVMQPDPTPQNIIIQQPEIKPDLKMKVDATTIGDKISGWIKCVFWLLLSGVAVGVVATLSNFGFGLFGKFDSWVDKKIRALIAYLAGGDEQLENKSKNFVLNVLKDTVKNMKEKKSTDNDTPWYCGKYSPFC